MALLASIREDLYLAGVLIPATELKTGKDKHLDPILWQVSCQCETTGETILIKPEIAGGGKYVFQSIDLEFHN